MQKLLRSQRRHGKAQTALPVARTDSGLQTIAENEPSPQADAATVQVRCLSVYSK